MKKAFTLAEVLITLTIIGVIAAITIPNLMQSWQERHTISAVKEAYSLLDNAIKQMVREEGPIVDWGSENITSSNLINKLNDYLKIEKTCTNGTCYQNSTTATFKRFSSGNDSRASISVVLGTGYVLANGMIIKPIIERKDISVDAFFRKEVSLGYVFVDVNGAKGPNRYGYDIFFLDFDEKGLRPYHVDSMHFGAKSLCSINPGLAYGINDGRSCYEWILKHGNLDYQKRDVKAEW